MFEHEYPGRLIKQNHASVKPQNLLFFDTETKQRRVGKEIHQRMYMAWTCYVRIRSSGEQDTEVWTFWDKTYPLNKYIAQLVRDKTRLWVFGHNIFFDLQASDFFYYFTSWKWMLNFWYDKAMTYILSISKERRKITCISTTNYFPFGLKELGKLVGLPKQEVNFETDDFDTIKAYCKRDVEIIKAAIEYYLKFITSNDFGTFKMTKGSQAMAAYRHRFMHDKIFVHDNKDISDFERLAYHGGRVECFYTGRVRSGPFVSLDVNSMYPYVMRSRSYPTKLLGCYEYPSKALVKESLKSFCVIAECALSTRDPAYAVLRKNKIIFPIGTFIAYVCTEGLRYALERGHLHSVRKMTVYEKGHIFNDYVNYLMDLKIRYEHEGNKIMRTITKDMLNSLYGKWAQQLDVTEEFEDLTGTGYYREEILDAVTGKMEIVTKLFNKQIIQYDKVPGKNSFVAISAHVTEYARFVLWRAIKAIGRSKVLYCDTDSMIIRKCDLRDLSINIDPQELGAWKIEKQAPSLILYGPKDYVMGKIIKHKGVPKDAVKIKEGVYKYIQWPRQDTHLRRQITRYFITVETTKTLKREYDKGLVLKNGKVRPFFLTEFLTPP